MVQLVYQVSLAEITPKCNSFKFKSLGKYLRHLLNDATPLKQVYVTRVTERRRLKSISRALYWSRYDSVLVL